jgi:tetratricopeptide (TPR) repeat protein
MWSERGYSLQALLLLFVAIIAFVYFLIRSRRSRRGLSRAIDATKAIKDLMASYRQGDFQAVLQKSERLKNGSSKTPEYCFYRGKALYQLGRLAEAEASLQEGRSLEQDERRVALSTEALGYALLEQQRYADAIAYFESCIRIWPDRGCGHRAVAETLLRQGKATEALVRAQQAAAIDRNAQALSEEIHNFNLGEALATLAWAIAADSGDASEVTKLVTEALPSCGGNNKPILGQVHYFAGRAYSSLGMRERIGEHFEQAMSADPQGNYGRLARTAAASPAA